MGRSFRIIAFAIGMIIDKRRGYIHRNPVRVGLCQDAREYLYSSACSGFALDAAPQPLKPVTLGVSSWG